MSFYDKFDYLCKQKPISMSKACTDMGLSRSVAAKWKSVGGSPSYATMVKIADYFGTTVAWLNSEDSTPEIPKDAVVEMNGRNVNVSTLLANIESQIGELRVAVEQPVISPEKQRLLDAVDGMDREQLIHLLNLIESIKGK